MIGALITAVIVLCFVVLSQLAVIYGLANRLVRQSGQSGMSAAAVLKQAEKMLIESTPDVPASEYKPHRMGKKIGTTGPIEAMPSYMEAKK